MTLIQICQAILIYYALNALLALQIFDPRSKNFQDIMAEPVSRLRPGAVLIAALHLTLPILLAAQVHPRVIRMRLLRIVIFVLRMRSKALMFQVLRRVPAAHRPALRANFQKIEAQGGILMSIRHDHKTDDDDASA